MDSKNKETFDNWLKKEYPELYKKLTDTDALHDSYLTLVRLSYILPEEYMASLKRAYHLNRRRYVQYAFRYIVPDPRFWLFKEDMKEPIDEPYEEEEEKSLEPFLQWLPDHSTMREYYILRSFYYEKLSIKEIAHLYNITKKEVTELINTKCEEYRSRKYLHITREINGRRHEVNYSLYFSRNKGVVIPSKRLVEYLQLKEGDIIYFFKHNDGYYISTMRPTFYLDIKLSSKAERMQGYCKCLVNDILDEVRGRNSCTLSVSVIETKIEGVTCYKINKDNPLKLN